MFLSPVLPAQQRLHVQDQTDISVPHNGAAGYAAALRLKFKKEAVPYDDRTCIVVVDINQIPIGLIVDNVNEVMNIPDEDIAPPPDARASFDNRYIKGIGKAEGTVQLLLDCEKLLMADEIASLESL